jgi:rubrerythrin
LNTDKLEDIFLSAIQGEINDRKTYLHLADRMENTFLKGKLRFLADEEEKHKMTLEEMYTAYFPNKNIILPEIVHGAELDNNIGESLKLIQILETAMEYEKAAQNNYLLLADKISNDQESSVILTYIAAMEESHYNLLRLEKEYLERRKEKQNVNHPP